MKKINFTEEEILKIISSYQIDHESTFEIAKKYNVSNSTICRVFKNNNIKRDICGRKYFFEEDFFRKIDTDRKAYWLGLFYADGCVATNDTFSLGFKREDRYILETLARDVNYAGDIIDIEEFKSIGGRPPKKYYSSRINLCSKKFCNHLKEKGLSVNKTFRLTYPKYITKKLHKHFIRGLFDGDGFITISKNAGRWGIIGQLNLLENVKNILLNEVNVTTNIYKKPNNCWDLGLDFHVGKFYNNKTNLDDLLILKKWLYEKSNLYFNRKKNSFDKIQLPPKLSGLSVIEASCLIGVSEKTLRRWIKSKKINSYKEGMYTRISLKELENYVV